MTESQRRSAVARKRSKAQGVGGKPTNVATFAKRKKAMGGGFMMKRASYMGGGLTEATARLKRQGLKAGSVARGCGAIMSDRKKKTRMV